MRTRRQWPCGTSRRGPPTPLVRIYCFSTHCVRHPGRGALLHLLDWPLTTHHLPPTNLLLTTYYYYYIVGGVLRRPAARPGGHPRRVGRGGGARVELLLTLGRRRPARQGARRRHGVSSGQGRRRVAEPAAGRLARDPRALMTASLLNYCFTTHCLSSHLALANCYSQPPGELQRRPCDAGGGPACAARARGGTRAVPAAAPLGKVRAADRLARVGGVFLWRAPPPLPRALRRARPDGKVPEPSRQRDAIWEDATIVASACVHFVCDA